MRMNIQLSTWGKMFNSVAIRAKESKIVQAIISALSINVMSLEYPRDCVIPTLITLQLYPTSYQQGPSFWVPPMSLSTTRIGTILKSAGVKPIYNLLSPTDHTFDSHLYSDKKLSFTRIRTKAGLTGVSKWTCKFYSTEFTVLNKELLWGPSIWKRPSVSHTPLSGALT